MISDSPTCTFSALPVKGVNKPTVPPPINGNYTEWTKWSECSATCGGGSQIRTRNCTNPPPQYGGRNCSGIGPANQTLECKPDPCRKFKWTEEFKSISNFCVWNRVQHLPLIVFLSCNLIQQSMANTPIGQSGQHALRLVKEETKHGQGFVHLQNTVEKTARR